MSEVYSIDVEITVPVYDTEVEDRVVDAVTNLFPNADVERLDGELLATTHSLERFAEKLREREILDTARGAFLDSLRGDTFSFALAKQPAFVGVVNFAVGDPDELGDIHVRVRVNEPSAEAFIDRLAPATEDGRPVDDEWAP
ncbi:MAG: RNA-binding domain-containing protein [Halobacteriales archaeon]